MAINSSHLLIISIIIISITLSSISNPVSSLPFVVFHGIADKCSNDGVSAFTELLSNWSGSQGYCIEIGNGEQDSWFMPFMDQTSIACEKVKQMSELKDGYSIIGLSQGNMVGRGVLEFCDEGPPLSFRDCLSSFPIDIQEFLKVKNFISLAGPHAGEASIPFCGSGLFCKLVDWFIKFAIYCDFVQEHLAPAGYVKIPNDIDDYKSGCTFLPKLNNEVFINSTYKERFSSLTNLVLIMFDGDTILVPKETSWFGYYPEGSWSPILSAQETTLYKEDWIGLKKLDEAGKVKFLKVPGTHLEISLIEMQSYILPYLVEENTTQLTSQSPRSFSLQNYINRAVGPEEEDFKIKLHNRS